MEETRVTFALPCDLEVGHSGWMEGKDVAAQLRLAAGLPVQRANHAVKPTLAGLDLLHRYAVVGVSLKMICAFERWLSWLLAS